MSNIIVMAFLPRNIVSCLLKKGLQRGVTGTPGPPLATPLTFYLSGLVELKELVLAGVNGM